MRKYQIYKDLSRKQPVKIFSEEERKIMFASYLAKQETAKTTVGEEHETTPICDPKSE